MVPQDPVADVALGIEIEEPAEDRQQQDHTAQRGQRLSHRFHLRLPPVNNLSFHGEVNP